MPSGNIRSSMVEYRIYFARLAGEIVQSQGLRGDLVRTN
jgi:hypothetical protein